MVEDDLHALALMAAQAGAAAIRAVAAEHLDVRAKGGIEDYVTNADHAAEHAILDVILTARPGDEIVAEESGRRPGASGVIWFVDPIDGTANFIAGSPDYAISIAAHRDDAPTVAIVFRPVNNGWLATSATGLVGTLMPRMAPDKPLSDARITISRPHPAELRAEAMRLRENLLPHVMAEQRIGSAACALLYVATGVIDAYISVGLPLWDTAAGHHLVQRAGGSVQTTTSLDGTKVSIAGSPGVAVKVRETILGERGISSRSSS